MTQAHKYTEDASMNVSDIARIVSELERDGIQVHAVDTVRQRIVLLIDRPPANVQGHLRMRKPNGYGGIERVLVAEHSDVQLQWIEHEGRRPPAAMRRLEVVRG
jgi:hypothetical protein